MKKEIETLQALIYPHKCMVCRVVLDKAMLEVGMHYICSKCASGMLVHHVCKRCGRPYAVEEECLYCKEMPSEIKRMVGIFPYRGAYKKSVLRWKYQGIRKYGKGFAHLLRGQLLEIGDIDAFIPVPLSKDRYRKRGFNQALDLAYALSELVDKPVWDILERYRYTKPQSSCTKEERKKNIKDTIRVKENSFFNKTSSQIDNEVKNIVIIDDIYTTGATIYECIRAIIERYREDINLYVIVAAITI